MSERRPERDTYDAAIELHPWNAVARTAFAVVKRTYTIKEGALALAEPKPLALDVRDPSFDGKWPSGSDFWPFKSATDVVVLGNAYAPGGRPAVRGRASVKVGRALKVAAIFGDRTLEWRDGRPAISEPAPFTEVPIDLAHAYGGCDPSVVGALPTTFADVLRGATDHPGNYPRNIMGKGYVIGDWPREAPVALPNVEDANDRLTLERMFASSPEAWFRQPIPCVFGWTYASQFPRSWYLGFETWFPIARDTVLPEVSRGFMPEAWFDMKRSPLAPRPEMPEPIFFQEASAGMTFVNLAAGTPIEIHGMHPERETLSFELPATPSIEIACEGDRVEVEPTLLHAVITPHVGRVELTWAAIRKDLPRAFMKGLHGLIPLSVCVDGDRPIEYVTPEPILMQVRRAQREGRIASGASGPSIEIAGELSAPVPRRRRDQRSRAQSVVKNDVDVATGRLMLSAIDFEIAGELPLTIARHYSSSMAWRTGALGPGWSHPFESAVWIEGDRLFHRTLDGREIEVVLTDGELGLGERLACPSEGLAVLRLSTDAFDVVREDGTRLRYHTVDQAVSIGAPTARLRAIIGANGRYAELRHDVHGRLAELVLPAGEPVRFEHDARGRLTTILAPHGRDMVVAARYEYSGEGALLLAVDGSGVEHRYRYAAGLLSNRVSASGIGFEYRYEDSADGPRCAAVVAAGRLLGETLFNPEARTAVAIDARGNARSVGLDADYRVIRAVDVHGREDTFAYEDRAGMLVSSRTPDGATKVFYDRNLFVAEIASPGSGSIELEHDASGHLCRLVDADGRAARWAWDAVGRLSAAVDRGGTSVVYDYHGEHGPLAAVTTPADVHLILRRDASTHGVVAIERGGGARKARRDTLGRIIHITNELGASAHYHYDPSGRVRAVELPGAIVRTVERDAEGRVIRYSDGASAYVLERDGLGELLRVNEGGGPLLVRDAEGRVTAVESERGERWQLVRDAAGRVNQEIGPEDERHLAERDHAGRIVAWASPIARTRITRDAAGRPTVLEHDAGLPQRFAYSRGGRLLRAEQGSHAVVFERDGEGRATLEAQGAFTVRSVFDLRDERVAIDSSLGAVVRVERDERGAATELIARHDGREVRVHFERDACGRERVRHLPGGIRLEWQRDGLGRPIARRVVFGDRELTSTRFAWQGVERLVAMKESGRGTIQYVHDARGRLVRAVAGTGGVLLVLDDAGNFCGVGEPGDHRYAPGGKLLEAYGIVYRYDAAGRRVEKETPDGTKTRYAWDALDRITHVAIGDDRHVSYQHDALGRCVRRREEERTGSVWSTTRETEYVWDGLSLLHEIDRDGVVTWLWERGLLLGKIGPDGAFAALSDAMGNPTELIAAGGQLAWRGGVDMFGALARDVAATDNPWRLRGHREDPATGLAHTIFRAYDPENCAYLSPSPLGIAGGPSLYAYLSDPLVDASPLGLGRGYATFVGAVGSERLGAEHVDLVVRALDRHDGAAGPRRVFDAGAAAVALPDPEAELWDLWERYRPERQLPPSTLPVPPPLA
jgi:RHS repeat-associated protein